MRIAGGLIQHRNDVVLPIIQYPAQLNDAAARAIDRGIQSVQNSFSAPRSSEIVLPPLGL
jgi:hypothetical protein